MDHSNEVSQSTLPSTLQTSILDPRTMLQDSNASAANLFSFYGFRGFLHENENDLFLRLHVLDCGNAVTCMHRKLDDCVSPYGNDRCRLPVAALRALCVAFQSLYYLADDSKIIPEDLEREVHTFARHCLCAEHSGCNKAVHCLAERLLLAVQRWQCRRVFMDEPDGPPSTPPEERPGASRLSQFLFRAPARSPRRRPRLRSRFMDLELGNDSWGHQNEREQQITGHSRVISTSSSSQRIHRSNGTPIPIEQPTPVDRTSDERESRYQQLKSAMVKIAKI